MIPTVSLHNSVESFIYLENYYGSIVTYVVRSVCTLVHLHNEVDSCYKTTNFPGVVTYVQVRVDPEVPRGVFNVYWFIQFIKFCEIKS